MVFLFMRPCLPTALFLQDTGRTSLIKKQTCSIPSPPHYSLCALALRARYWDPALKAEWLISSQAAISPPLARSENQWIYILNMLLRGNISSWHFRDIELRYRDFQVTRAHALCVPYPWYFTFNFLGALGIAQHFLFSKPSLLISVTAVS